MRRALRALLVTVTLPFVSCTGDVALESAQVFDQACEQLARAQSPTDALRAAAAFEELRRDGVDSGVLLYDLGNAYYRGGKLGEAIAAYRQAQIYHPRDPYLAANLALARRGTASQDPPRTWVDTVVFWHDWLGLHELRAVLLLAAAATSLAILLTSLLPRARVVWHGVAACSALCVAAAAISFALHWQRFERTERGVVTAAEVVARKGDDESFAPWINEPLRLGTEFIVRERRGEWLWIELGGELEGWIPADAAKTYRLSADSDGS